jgi:hypothetical protein
VGIHLEAVNDDFWILDFRFGLNAGDAVTEATRSAVIRNPKSNPK